MPGDSITVDSWGAGIQPAGITPQESLDYLVLRLLYNNSTCTLYSIIFMYSNESYLPYFLDLFLSSSTFLLIVRVHDYCIMFM